MGTCPPPSKISCSLQQERKFVLGECRNVPPSDKYRKKFIVFYTCSLWVRTAAILSSVSCIHYGFLHKLIKNNVFRVPITERNSLFFINITTRQQFFKGVSEKL